MPSDNPDYPPFVLSGSACRPPDLALSPEVSQRLVHELANLLDGSLRNVGLVIANLNQTPSGSDRSQEEEQLLTRLQAANQAMRQMASLIGQWRHQAAASDAPSPSSLSLTLGEVVQQAAQLLMPTATTQRILITTCLSDEVAGLPAGPVYPILVNALQNSIEAIVDHAVEGTVDTGDDEAIGRIELIGQVREGQVEFQIRDDGPGIDPALTDTNGRFVFGRTTKPDGQGVGLALSRDIVHHLGGHLDLANRLHARGTLLTLRYPLKSITDET